MREALQVGTWGRYLGFERKARSPGLAVSREAILVMGSVVWPRIGVFGKRDFS